MAEGLIGPFPAKVESRCNICRQPTLVGQKIQQDPHKPTWINTKYGNKVVKNFAHVECVQSNVRAGEQLKHIGELTAARAVRNEQTASSGVSGIVAKFKDGLGIQMQAFRELAELVDALSVDVAQDEDPFAGLEGEIPY